MEPLPSDVARLVLGYLLDTCPEVAAQFLAKSPDLAEVRRMRPRAQRPLGPSLVELLTEHTTASSLVYDVDSTMSWPGGCNSSSDFLHKLRRLLSVVTETQKGALVVPSGSSETFHRPEEAAGGTCQDRVAATAGRWTVDPAAAPASDWDETPAVGGDCADAPADEAAVGGSPEKGETARDAPLESPDDSPALVIDYDSPAVVTDCDSPAHCLETRADPCAAIQTQLTSSGTRPTTGNPVVVKAPSKGTEAYLVCGRGGSRPGSGESNSGDQSVELKEADRGRRRKRRPKRRSDPETLTAAASGRAKPVGQPAGWVFGQVRHCQSMNRAATTPTCLPASEPSQQKPAPVRSESQQLPEGPHCASDAGQQDSPPPSLPAATDLPQSPSVPSPSPPASSTADPSAMPSSPAPRPAATDAPFTPPPSAPSVDPTSLIRATAQSVCPESPSRAVERRGRKKAAPRRRPLSECGTIVVQPGAIRSRSPVARRSASSKGTSEMPAKKGTASESPDKEGRVVESSVSFGRMSERCSGEDGGAESPVKEASVPPSSPGVESGTPKPLGGRDSAVAPIVKHDPSPSPPSAQCAAAPSPAQFSPIADAAVRSPSVDSTTSFQSPAPDVDSSFGVSPATSLASTVRSCADSSDASPLLRGGGDRLRPAPPGCDSTGGGGTSPTPSQLSGRSSQLSERMEPPSDRSTPFSQRSLHICLSPSSGKTPSVSGSLRADETPTSVRQSVRRRTGISGGSSAGRRARAPRRRLLAESRRISESPLPDAGRPSAQSTPTAAAAAAVGRVSGAVEDSLSDGVSRTPLRTVRRDGPVASGRSGAKRTLPVTADRHPGPPEKVSSKGNNKNLLQSIDIASFVSRIHSVGSI